MSHYVNGYIGRGTSINLAGFGATGNPMEMFWNTLKPMQDVYKQANTAFTSMLPPGLLPSSTTKTTNKASPSSSVADPTPSNKGKYLLAGVGAVGVIGLVALVLKKKKD